MILQSQTSLTSNDMWSPLACDKDNLEELEFTLDKQRNFDNLLEGSNFQNKRAEPAQDGWKDR